MMLVICSENDEEIISLNDKISRLIKVISKAVSIHPVGREIFARESPLEI